VKKSEREEDKKIERGEIQKIEKFEKKLKVSINYAATRFIHVFKLGVQTNWIWSDSG
jgi:hypothetical protein